MQVQDPAFSGIQENILDGLWWVSCSLDPVTFLTMGVPSVPQKICWLSLSSGVNLKSWEITVLHGAQKKTHRLDPSL